jgi:ppGpp synthetase/RelA/SpoT-type nucleotidyltranferase
MLAKKDADVRNKLYNMFLGSGIKASNPVNQILNNHGLLIAKYEKATDLLNHDLRLLWAKFISIIGDDFIKYTNARMKDEDSILVKLFNKSWEENGFYKNWPAAATKGMLGRLTDYSVLKKVYREIKDLVGGRIILGCKKDVRDYVEWFKKEFADREYKVLPLSKDKDYISYPSRGYYGYHFFVRVPTQTKKGKRGRPYQIAEIQIQSLLGRAFADFSHSTIFKKIKVPGNQIFTAKIDYELELISGGLQVTDGLFGLLREQIDD